MLQRLIACLILVPGVSLATDPPPLSDNAELRGLFDADQGDRMPPEDKLLSANIDWNVVSARDRAREKRVKELLVADALRTGADYYHAAMVLQHAPKPEDYLLAHELCVVAISKGFQAARWLSAASLDRFLTNIGRPQRFGTQYFSKDLEHPVTLVATDPDVPDSLRRALDVPTLAEAKLKEAQFAREFEEARKAKPASP